MVSPVKERYVCFVMLLLFLLLLLWLVNVMISCKINVSLRFCSLYNLLGESPEWCEPWPITTMAHNGGFLILEVLVFSHLFLHLVFHWFICPSGWLFIHLFICSFVYLLFQHFINKYCFCALSVWKVYPVLPLQTVIDRWRR